MSRWARVTVATMLAATTAVAGCSSSTSTGPSESAAPGRSGQASAGSSSGAVSAPTRVTGKPASVTILASGDIIGQYDIVTAARRASGYDFMPYLSPLAPVVAKGDVKICQMESPLSPDDTNLTRPDGDGAPSFNAPHEMAEAVKKLGFDGCSTANNHAYDRSLAGLVNTRKVMAGLALAASGPGADAQTPGDPVFYEAGGLKIAQLSYSYTLDNRFNDQQGTPADAGWIKSNLYSVRSPEGIEQDAAAARTKGADLVVVSMHWGTEYKPVTAEQRRYAKALLSSGQVDWIIGNHPHIVQPCEKIDGRYVTYALGNTMSSQRPDYWLQQSGFHVDDGAIAAVTFTRANDGTISEKMAFQPTHQAYADHVVRPAAAGSDAFERVSTTMTAAGCDARPMG